MTPGLPVVEPWPRSRLLKEERELMGFYITGHPLESYSAEARAFATAELGKLEDEEAGNGIGSSNGHQNGFHRGPSHQLFGIITDVQHRTTKSGKPIAFATIEDFTGQGEVVCFSNVYDKVQNYLRVDDVVMVNGEVEIRGGSVKIIGRDVLPMWKVREQLVKAIVVRVHTERVDETIIDKLRLLCEENRGNCKLFFDLDAPDLPLGPQRIRSRKFVVDPTPELMAGMTRLFGKDNVILQGEA
jgi:DNA polymerase-3 subunit alpha